MVESWWLFQWLQFFVVKVEVSGKRRSCGVMVVVVTMMAGGGGYSGHVVVCCVMSDKYFLL